MAAAARPMSQQTLASLHVRPARCADVHESLPPLLLSAAAVVRCHCITLNLLPLPLLLLRLLPPVQPANLGSGRPRPAWMSLQRITGFGLWGPTAGCQVRRLLPAACCLPSYLRHACANSLLMSSARVWLNAALHRGPSLKQQQQSQCPVRL